MNLNEYNKLFHKLELNLVAFKPLMECDQEVLKLVNAAIEAEREACAQVCVEQAKIVSNQANGKTVASHCAHYVRARGQE